jgi:formamidopyrimidine-DNA glycosylase
LSEAEAKRLHEKLQSVIRTAVDANADDTHYPTHWLFHRRWGKRTDVTTARGEAIEHISIGGRTTAWVPAVQR